MIHSHRKVSFSHFSKHRHQKECFTHAGSFSCMMVKISVKNESVCVGLAHWKSYFFERPWQKIYLSKIGIYDTSAKRKFSCTRFSVYDTSEASIIIENRVQETVRTSVIQYFLSLAARKSRLYYHILVSCWPKWG